MTYGIICEFNPFHNGHKHLIDSIKKENDTVICVMSGNFVQRGEFAIYDKWERTRTAIKNGADIVIELPTVYSTLSAEGFCRAGIKLLESTNVVDTVAFGAECDDINELKNIADNLKSYDEKIREELKSGVSFPVARKKVIDSDILDSPNNILALEYISATRLNCEVIKRIGDGHDTSDINYSASAIRKTLNDDTVFSQRNCEKAILSYLRRLSTDDLKEINDVSEGLENRICDAIRTATSLDELYNLIKTKRYTMSRIRRIILRAYLGIKKSDVVSMPYIRLLGFNENGKKVLSKMKENANLPIISRFADITYLDDNAKNMLINECKYTDLYNLGYKKPLPCGTEQRSQIVLM